MDLWGKDLYTHLAEAYRSRARYCVLFVSRHYAKKVWTNHERMSAQERALQSAREYILPVRFWSQPHSCATPPCHDGARLTQLQDPLLA